MDSEAVTIDVGLKSEGRVPLKELAASGQSPSVAIAMKSRSMSSVWKISMVRVLSRDKARREEAWAFGNFIRKTGTCDGHYLWKGQSGFTVDLSGATAFLPGSQVDIRPGMTWPVDGYTTTIPNPEN